MPAGPFRLRASRGGSFTFFGDLDKDRFMAPRLLGNLRDAGRYPFNGRFGYGEQAQVIEGSLRQPDPR